MRGGGVVVGAERADNRFQAVVIQSSLVQSAGGIWQWETARRT